MTKLELLDKIETLSFKTFLIAIEEYRQAERAIVGASAISQDIQNVFSTWHTNLNSYKHELSVLNPVVLSVEETPVA